MDGRPLRNAVEHWVAQLSKPDSERDENAFAGFLLAVFQAHIGIYEELAAIRRALEHVPTHEEHTMNLSVERVVTLLTPAFAAISAALVAWLGAHFPGLPHLNPADVTALEIAGASAGAGAALKWLHGRQQFLSQAASVEAFVRAEVAKAAASQQAGPALHDIEDLLKSHTDQIVQSIAAAVHAPPSVAQVADEILSRAAQGKPAEPPAAA